jgi:Mg-chelatase subunit ChlD
MAKTEVLGGQQGHVTDVKTLGSVRPSPLVQRATATIGATERRSSTANTANVILVDHSGSTSDPIGRGDARAKIDGIKEAVSSFCATIPPTAHLSIIAFESRARTLRKMEPVGQKKLDTIKAIQQVRPQGTTAMLDALLLAEGELRNAPDVLVKRVYLLTDGLPDKNPVAVADRIKTQGAQMHTIGFGDGDCIDEELLRNVASLSGSGSPLYYHFTEARQLTGFLKRESKTLTQ